MKWFFSWPPQIGFARPVLATSLSVMPAAAAHASIISVSACDGATLTQPFLKWGDSDPYKLVPGGDFETDAKGWSLTGGAQVVAGQRAVRRDRLGREVLRSTSPPAPAPSRRSRASTPPIHPSASSIATAASSRRRSSRSSTSCRCWATWRCPSARRSSTRPGAHRCRCSPLRPYRVSWAEATPRLLFASRR